MMLFVRLKFCDDKEFCVTRTAMTFSVKLFASYFSVMTCSTSTHVNLRKVSPQKTDFNVRYPSSGWA
jgi:hypothetical protein